MGAITNEMYYDLIMEGHKESLDAFECSYEDAEYDHEHTVELFKDPSLPFKNQFQTLDDFIIYRKQWSLINKAHYRFVLYLQSQQKIFERDYFVPEIDFLIRCVDALNIKIDLEKMKYPNFIPKSIKGEFGGTITEGNRFKRLIDSLVYYKVFISQMIKGLNNAEQVKNEPQQPKTAKQLYTPKPCFKAELIDGITDVLNAYFDKTQHAELRQVIQSGNNTSEKLLFRDSGNKLTDYFKRLFEKGTITGCAKKDLINWIVDNFTFIHRKIQKEFIYKTVEKTISGTEQPCKNPIT